MGEIKRLYKSTKTVHIDPNLHKLYKRLADKDEVGLQNMINTGLRDYINRRLKEDFL